MAEEPVVLEHVDVEYCPTCDVPLCYCRFFKLHGDAPAEGAEGEAAEAKPKQEAKKGGKGKELPKITITVKNRRARKFTTSVANIEPYGLNLKDVQKAISKKMSTAASTKKKDGMVSIVIQGNAGNEVRDILKNQFKIPQKSIEIIVKNQKKAEPKQPPPQEINEE